MSLMISILEIVKTVWKLLWLRKVTQFLLAFIFSIIREIKIGREIKGREAAGWDMRPRARAEGKGMFLCLGSTVNSQEGQWRRKGPFRRDRTRAQQPSTQEDRRRRAHAVLEPPSVWPSLGVCSPMQTGAGAWDTGLESRPGDRATAGGEETACGSGSEEAWNPECLRGDPVHLRREAPKLCSSRGAAPIAASLPMCWTYLQNRNWVTGQKTNAGIREESGERDKLGDWDWRIYTAVYKTDN